MLAFVRLHHPLAFVHRDFLLLASCLDARCNEVRRLSRRIIIRLFDDVKKKVQKNLRVRTTPTRSRIASTRRHHRTTCCSRLPSLRRSSFRLSISVLDGARFSLPLISPAHRATTARDTTRIARDTLDMHSLHCDASPRDPHEQCVCGKHKRRWPTSRTRRERRAASVLRRRSRASAGIARTLWHRCARSARACVRRSRRRMRGRALARRR